MTQWPNRDVSVGPNPAGTAGAAKRPILVSLSYGPDLDLSIALSPLEAEFIVKALHNRLEALY